MKQQKALQIEWIELSDCVPNDYQSGKRTQDSAMKAITKSVAAKGVKTPPEVVKLPNGKYMIVDGHRRITAALSCGLTRLQCSIVAGSAREASLGFIEHGAVTRKVSGPDIFYAYALALKKNDIEIRDGIIQAHGGFGGKVQRCVRIFGKARTIEIGLTAEYSIKFIDLVEDLRDFLRQTDMRYPKSRKPVKDRDIGEWVVHNKLQQWLSIKTRTGAMNRGETGLKLAHRVLGMIERNEKPRLVKASKETVA